MARNSGLLILAFLLSGGFVGCRTTSAGRPTAKDPGITDLRGEEGPESSSSLYQKAVNVATTPEEKVRAYLGLGKAQLRQGRAETALKSFYEARRFGGAGPQASAVHQGLGDAYFDLGELSLARRYLAKALEGNGVRDRDVTCAKLVVCARLLDDAAGAAHYRDQMPEIISGEARSILEMQPQPRETPAVAEAPTRPRSWSAIGRSGLPPSASSSEKLQIYSRASWNARAPRRNIEMMGQIDKITVHHSGGDDILSGSAADSAEEIRKIQNYHQNDHGWADIGYHFVIDRSGAIWQGRKLRYQGAHARGSANFGNVGIVVLGNYEHQRLNGAQKESLATLVETLCEHFDVSPSKIYTHREILAGKTDCPGPELSRCVSEIRNNLRRRLVAYRGAGKD